MNNEKNVYSGKVPINALYLQESMAEVEHQGVLRWHCTRPGNSC